MHGNLNEPIGRFGQTELWFATPAAEDFFDPATLSPADQKRFSAPRGKRRQQEFKVSRALKAFTVAERAGTAFSLSHSAGHAALLLGPTTAKLGVDLEIARPRDVLRIAHDVFHESEFRALSMTGESERLRDFYTLWTLKEAFIKALDLNLFDGLRRCVFVRSALRTWRSSIPTESHWTARVYQPHADFYLAMAWIGGETQTNILEWPPKRPAQWPLIAAATSAARPE